MINFYGDNNHFILPLAASKKPCGESYSFHLKKWNCNMILPFSSMHKYVRKDSIKMNEYVTPLSYIMKNLIQNMVRCFRHLFNGTQKNNNILKLIQMKINE